jgi:hypothetical protein
MTISRFAAAGALLVLSGCASGPLGGPQGGLNYAAGSGLGRELGEREVDALYPVFLEAVERGRAGEAKLWTAGSASGSVTPGDYFVANLKPDPRTLIPVDGGLDLGHSLETELGLHALKGNGNLRAGPSTEARILAVLEAGTPVDVVGKAAGTPFMLSAIGGRVKGYLHESLLVKAPGTELELAGGPVRRAHLCRAFTQTLAIFGRSDRWTGIACDRGNGWRLEPAAAAS